MNGLGNTPPGIHADGALLGGFWGDLAELELFAEHHRGADDGRGAMYSRLREVGGMLVESICGAALYIRSGANSGMDSQ